MPKVIKERKKAVSLKHLGSEDTPSMQPLMINGGTMVLPWSCSCRVIYMWALGLWDEFCTSHFIFFLITNLHVGVHAFLLEKTSSPSESLFNPSEVPHNPESRHKWVIVTKRLFSSSSSSCETGHTPGPTEQTCWRDDRSRPWIEKHRRADRCPAPWNTQETTVGSRFPAVTDHMSRLEASPENLRNRQDGGSGLSAVPTTARINPF